MIFPITGQNSDEHETKQGNQGSRTTSKLTCLKRFWGLELKKTIDL